MSKMPLNKVIFGGGRKVQLSCSEKILRRIQQRNYGLSSIFFSKAPETLSNIPKDLDELVMKESPKLQPVPRKKYGLSKVEEKDIELVNSLKEGNIFYPYEGPYDRVWNILKDDVKCGLRKVFYALTKVKLGPLEPVFFPRYTDILIIGGGILGLTIAYTIKTKFPHGPNVFVVDKDCNFPPLSTNLGQGLISYQFFSEEEEIPLLKYGAEFFSSFSRNTQVNELPPFKLAYEPLGSLVLVDNSNVDKAIKRIELLKNHGIHNKVLDSEILNHKFPWLNTKDIVFGTLGMINEGLIDPWNYMFGLKSKCINLGVTFITAEVIDFGFIERMPSRVVCKLPDGSYNSIDFTNCVIASGMEALNLTEVLNSSDKFSLIVKLPLKEKLKYEYCFYAPDGPGLNTPIVIDSSYGTYFRREGLLGYYVAGVLSVSDDEDAENNPYNVFHNRIKPFLLERVPNFKNMKLVNGWVDLQEHCFSNEMGILGSHPEADNIMYALGFSHLGLQYMPAVARAVMETMLCDDYQTIDFTNYHLENLWKKHHLEAEKKKKELLESKKRIPLTS